MNNSAKQLFSQDINNPNYHLNNWFQFKELLENKILK